MNRYYISMMQKMKIIFLLSIVYAFSAGPAIAEMFFRNPRVYNVDYSFELTPDPAKIDRSKDLRVWLPLPREWDSQKAVRIVSIEPEPDAIYEEPEYGNRLAYWDFGKGPEKSTYEASVKFRLESYDVRVEVDPDRVGPYDKSSNEYQLYTRSSRTIFLSSKIKEMARTAVGEEKNPFLQAKEIFNFVRKKMRYKILDYERGRGIQCLLAFPEKDKQTGEVYYEGCCSQFSALFIALCRAVGIPARSVKVVSGSSYLTDTDNLKSKYDFETKLSPDGLAAAQHYGSLSPHTWAEFYIPNYGWIPVDATAGRFGHKHNRQVILNKGRDVRIGPETPQNESEGYGSQWILLHNGRADFIFSAIWNIAKIQRAKITVLHHPDPFPADALTTYRDKLYPPADAEKKLREWRISGIRRVANLPLHPDKNNSLREVFVCHMLRKIVGDEIFSKIVDAYTEMRQRKREPLPVPRFIKLTEEVYGTPLDWFFEQWFERKELPRLKLTEAAAGKTKEGWEITGVIEQFSEEVFRSPIPLALTTEKGIEKRTIQIEERNTDFHISTSDRPEKLIVDPDYEVLMIRDMPPRLPLFWYVYPEISLVYGTAAEVEANKTAAERFNSDYLGLDEGIVMADRDVNEEDLEEDCIVLFGRPSTNTVCRKIADAFPVQFKNESFTWDETVYDDPTQGIAQIVPNPHEPDNLLILYAGLSGESTLQICDSYWYDSDASYFIFADDKKTVSGDWEVDSDLAWNFQAPVPCGDR